MSLVHEALQKAEREKLRKTGAAPAVPPGPVPKTAPVEPLVVEAMHVNPPAPHLAPARPVPVARPVPPPKSQYALLSVLFACVAVVAIVAIVYLVSRATSTLRESKEVVTASTTTRASADGGSRSVATAPAVPASQPAALTEQGPPRTAVTPAPVAIAATEPAGFKLTGIMKDPVNEGFIAVLNGRTVYEGYSVDGATVKKIERDRVTLDIPGQPDTVLRLF
jgi:hypothetical protein